ncbi:hypothetical protein ACE348_000089 [Campylobacter jejuni]
MPHLYSYEGQFVFAKGFNWARLIAWGSRYGPPLISYLGFMGVLWCICL